MPFSAAVRVGSSELLGGPDLAAKSKFYCLEVGHGLDEVREAGLEGGRRQPGDNDEVPPLVINIVEWDPANREFALVPVDEPTGSNPFLPAAYLPSVQQ